MKAKICGLSTHNAVETSVEYGADYLGFVFYPPSPRNVTARHAHLLAKNIPSSIKTVAVLVNPTNEALDSLLDEFQPDYLQLHGSETHDRLQEIRQLSGCRIMKSYSISSDADITAAETFRASADLLLFDAKPPKTSTLPGGNGLTFDWRLLQHRNLGNAWFLSGGLTVDNVSEAIRITGAGGVDVSSGVESSPGVKDLALIQAFLEKVKHYDR